MKNVKLVLSALLLMVSMSASAQFANSSAKSGGTKSGSILVKDCKNYGRFMFNYSPLHAKTTYELGKTSLDGSTTMSGFRLGYTQGISLSKKIPLFIEVGGELSINTKKEKTGKTWFGDYDENNNNADDDDDDDDDPYWAPGTRSDDYDDPYYYGDDGDYDDEKNFKYRSTMIALTIPVAVSYKLSFNNGLYVAPYVGVQFKLNLIGQYKTKYTGNDKETKKYWEDHGKTNWFSDDSSDKGGMGKDGAWNRFQMGWRIGANFGYKKFNFNIGYAGDISPLYKYDKNKETEKIKTGSVLIGVGCNF